MKEFIISFTNICRSMKLEYMLDPDFTCPVDTDSTFSTFEDDNTFIFSALIQVTTKHEAQTIINTAAFKNDGLSSWDHLMKWYDTEGTEESICAVTLDKLINLKLTKVHK